MSSKSLRDLMNEAEKEAPAGGGSRVWEQESHVLVEVVNSNAKIEGNFTPQVGVQLERKDTNARRWFTLYFNQGDERKDKAALASTGRKLSAMGAAPVLDALADSFGDDLQATLEGLASALRGVKFYADVRKYETNKSKDNTDLADADRDYRNDFDVSELLDGPAVPSFPTAAGFGAPAAPAAAPAAPAADEQPQLPATGFKPFGN